MELKAYLRAIRSAAPWLIVGTSVAVGISLLVSAYLMTPIYTASVSMLVNFADPSAQASTYTAALTSERLARTYAELITDQVVLRKAVDHSGLSADPAILGNRVRVVVPPDSAIIDLTVEDPDPNQAAALADAIVAVLIEHVSELQSDMGISASEIRPDQLDIRSAQRAELASALDSYVRSYGDLMGVYVALTDALQSRQIPNQVFSSAAMDELERNMREQMAETLTAISQLEAEIVDVESSAPTVGLSRTEWLGELSRLEELVSQYRAHRSELLSAQTGLLDAQMRLEQSELGFLLEQRALEVQAQTQLVTPPPPLPTSTPGLPLFEAQLAAVASEIAWVDQKLSTSEEDLATHLSTEPSAHVVTQQDIAAQTSSLREELQRKRQAYASLANNYLQYAQFLQSNELAPVPTDDIAELTARRALVLEQAGTIWEQVVGLRDKLSALDKGMFALLGPPIVVSGDAIPSSKPIRPDLVVNGLIAGASAFIMILLLVLLLEYLRGVEDQPIGLGAGHVNGNS